MVFTKQKLIVDTQKMKTYCPKQSSNHKRIVKEKGEKKELKNNQKAIKNMEIVRSCNK